MKFGVQLGVDAPTSPAELTLLAQGAERLGFASFWVGDHLLIPNAIDDSSHERGVGGSKRFADRTTSPTSEPMTTLAFLAGVTSTLRLGVAVLVVPLRNPVLSAKMLASIDSLAAGRLDIGVGAGWIEAEFEALRTPPYAERGAVTDDYLDAMIALWSQDNPEHSGPHWSVRAVSMFPHPVQQPHPPIWVGGNGGPAMRRAARIGQGWLPLFQPPEEIRQKRMVLERMCEDIGRPPDAVSLAVGCRFGFDDGSTSDRPLLSGTPVQMRDDVRRYQDVGIEELHLITATPGSRADHVLEAWSRFMDEVVAHL